jgi:hypothetical protein
MVDLCASVFTNAYIETQVLNPRDLSGIIEAEEKMLKELKKRGKL